MINTEKAIIRVHNVDFSYSGSSAEAMLLFNKLNLTVKEGEYIVVGGTNGSGKTTLAALLKGMIQPLSGEIYYQGKNITGQGINQEIGYIFSNAENQIVSPVVEDDIAFGLENRGACGKTIEMAVAGALEKVNAIDLQKELTHLLSGGEQQKVNIAGILALECKCIIFDEALSMLDPKSRIALLNILKQLNKEYGITIIQISHNLFELLSSDRVIYMSHGDILFDGKWEKLFENKLVSHYFTEKQKALIAFIQKMNDLTSEPLAFNGNMHEVIDQIIKVAKMPSNKQSV